MEIDVGYTDICSCSPDKYDRNHYILYEHNRAPGYYILLDRQQYVNGNTKFCTEAADEKYFYLGVASQTQYWKRRLRGRNKRNQQSMGVD